MVDTPEQGNCDIQPKEEIMMQLIPSGERETEMSVSMGAYESMRAWGTEHRRQYSSKNHHNFSISLHRMSNPFLDNIGKARDNPKALGADVVFQLSLSSCCENDESCGLINLLIQTLAAFRLLVRH